MCATKLKGLDLNGPFLRALWKLVAAIAKPPGNAIIWQACFQAATTFELNRPRLGATLAVAVAVAGLVAAVVVGGVGGIVVVVVRNVRVIVAVVLGCVVRKVMVIVLVFFPTVPTRFKPVLPTQTPQLGSHECPQPDGHRRCAKLYNII